MKTIFNLIQSDSLTNFLGWSAGGSGITVNVIAWTGLATINVWIAFLTGVIGLAFVSLKLYQKIVEIKNKK